MNKYDIENQLKEALEALKEAQEVLLYTSDYESKELDEIFHDLNDLISKLRVFYENE